MPALPLGSPSSRDSFIAREEERRCREPPPTGCSGAWSPRASSSRGRFYALIQEVIEEYDKLKRMAPRERPGTLQFSESLRLTELTPDELARRVMTAASEDTHEEPPLAGSTEQVESAPNALDRARTACTRAASGVDLVEPSSRLSTCEEVGVTPTIIADDNGEEKAPRKREYGREAVVVQPSLSEMASSNTDAVSAILRQKCARSQSTCDAIFELRSDWMPDTNVAIKIEARAKQKASEDSHAVTKTAKMKKQGFGSGINRSRTNTFAVVMTQEAAWVLHPQSNKRMAWEFMSLIWIFMDIVVMPLQLFVLPEGTWDVGILQAIVTIFWTVDILLTFRTGVYVDGELSFNHRLIAKRYMASWFAVDLIVVVTDWASMISFDSQANRIMQTFRMMRLLRLLRLAKLNRVIQACEQRLNSNFAHHLLSIVRLVLTVIVINHFLACLWYRLGLSYDDGWAVEYDIPSRGIPYGYFTSLHWSLTQFHASMEVQARNTAERVFSVIVVILALTGFSAFVSCITDMMIQLQKLSNDSSTKEHTLRSFLRENNISAALSVRVKIHVEQNMARSHRIQAETDLLNCLPKYVLMDLYNEARTPILDEHAFFKQLHEDFPRAVRMMCSDALRVMNFEPKETVFSAGDACPHMLFVKSGLLMYQLNPATVKSTDEDECPAELNVTHYKLGKNEWISEIALWTQWENTGDLTTVRSCSLYCLDYRQCAEVVKKYETAFADAVIYALNFLEFAKSASFVSDLGASLMTGSNGKSLVGSFLSNDIVNKHGSARGITVYEPRRRSVNTDDVYL